jgi:glycosyltransferase involved in cell wall biosynthesis
VGRLLPHKGIDYLIEAVDRETELRIAGRLWEPPLLSTYAEQFLALLKQLAEGKRLVVLNADDEQLVQEYASATSSARRENKH